jgi:D-alanyl-D-alanine carboxypeptidase/D-alanyl-D-alanine-endopeptidase (penicillin-binding protein 4)
LGDVPSRCTVSARVLALPSGEVLYSANADAPMKPASNMKLLTSATALARLGSAFRFHTALARHGDHLVVIGGGDPATGDPVLAEMMGRDRLALFERWATVLAERGIRRIRGDLILDDTIFDDVFVHPSWPSDQLQKWYAAPVAGINLNDNCLDVTVWPAGTPGQAARFELMPPNDWTRIINQTATRRQGVPTIGWGSSPGSFVLSGPCSTHGTLQSVAVTDPVAVFGSALRTHLASRGITIDGEIRRGRVRSPHGVLAPGVSVLDDSVTPLADVILRCNRDSQNFFAEAIFKKIGYARMFNAGELNPQGSWESGRAAVMAYLLSLGLGTDGLVIDDGSGLSHDNRVTAVVLTEVLRRAFTGPDRDLFISTLATPGGDGTFRRGLIDVDDGLYVKTGTINGVRALSGYVRTGDDQWLCFSLLCNDIRGKTQPVKDAQDRFCRVLVGQTAVPASASP